MPKPRILVPTPFFPPAYKAGGALKSVGNLVGALSNEYRFSVHTFNCDNDGIHNGEEPRKEIGQSEIFYHHPSTVNFRMTKGWIDNVDLIYLNGFFEPTFSLKMALARRLSRIRKSVPLLIAPRGEVFRETLALKSAKKALGLRAIRRSGIYADASWHASNQLEAEAIAQVARRLGQSRPRIFLASDIAGIGKSDADPSARDVPHLVFFSRISPKKNLDFALRVLARVSFPIHLDIIGPLEDAEYWKQCEAIIATLPGHHRVKHLGEIHPSEVAQALARYDLYFFPTRSENFGHTIQEALAAGVPVLISDQTPWQDLEAHGAGWNLPLNEAAFVNALSTFSSLDHKARLAMRAAARRHADHFGIQQAVESHRRMFDALLVSDRTSAPVAAAVV